MIPNSDPVAQRRTIDPAVKLKAIKAYLSREKGGEPRTVASICEEHGVGQPMLYRWLKQYNAGESLDHRKPGRKTPGNAITVRKPRAAAVVVRDDRQIPLGLAAPTPTIAAVQRPETAPLAQCEREELILLRHRVRQLERMLAAGLGV